MTNFFAEFFGTMLLITLGNGIVAGVLLKKSKSEGAGFLPITIGWGLAVTMAIYVAGKYSGAHLNPAVTIGLAAIGKFSWVEVPNYILAQMLGSFFGAVLVWIHYFPHWEKTEDSSLKLAVFCTSPAIRKFLPNLLSEIIGTFVLVFTILAIGSNNLADGLNPLIVGLLIVSIGLSLGGTTGWAINPARDLAPRIAHFILPIKGKGTSDWQYSLIPVFGPIIGGVLGAIVFNFLFQ